MAEANDRIVPLNELSDFEVASGDPDVRGWDVVGADGRKLGAVDQLLADTGAMKVRYLDVDLADELIGTGEDRHALIPIGYARLDEDHDRVVVDRLDSTRVRNLPAYGHEPVTRDYEVTVVRAWNPRHAGTGDLYADPAYDADRFYAARRGRRET